MRALTGNEAGDNERNDEHLEHAHEDVTREGHQSNGVGRGVRHLDDEAENGAHDDSEHSEDQK